MQRNSDAMRNPVNYIPRMSFPGIYNSPRGQEGPSRAANFIYYKPPPSQENQPMNQQIQGPPQPNQPEAPKAKLILDNVSGTVLPGQFLTIIGASGSGKTTLLSFLSGKSLAKNLLYKGEVYANGHLRSEVGYNSLTAFVQQDDILTDFMTVKENIFFACELRTQGSIEEMDRSCDQIIKSLGLNHVQHSRVGGIMKKIISGGERKRTSIAVELISRTPLIFLDEPTTGLDSVMATKITEALNRYAKAGNTIIASIHQPNSEMFKLFDQLMLLSHGKIIYFNRSDQVIDYFKGFGKPKYECPRRMNPAEFAMILMSSETFTVMMGYSKKQTKNLTHKEAISKYEKRVNKLVNRYEASPTKCDINKVGDNLSELTPENISQHIFKADISTQTRILLVRAFRITFRMYQENVARYSVLILMCLLTITLYYNMPNDVGYSIVMDRMGLFMMFAMVGFMTTMNAAITTFPEERAVFMREQVSGLYDVLPYYFSKLLCEYPYLLPGPLIMQIILYWACSLRNDASAFFVCWACSLAVSFYGHAFSLFIGIVVARREAVLLAMPVLFIPFMVLSGFYVNLSNVVAIAWVVQWISPFKYALMIYMRNEMEGRLFQYNPTARPPIPQYVLGDVILDIWGYDLSIGISFLALWMLYIGFTVFGFLALKYFVWKMVS